ncbi:putative FAD-binding oxidoreductase [Xylaria sp. FL0064]|nr:putative FAD-binding oxidoreductase [Xylaria sp. FL0064]
MFTTSSYKAIIVPLLVFLPLSSSYIHSLATSFCQSLNADIRFKNAVFLPGSSNYTQLSEENWSQTVWSKPSCILKPTTTIDLQQAVSLLVEADVKVAIRSGGHCPSPGAANIDQGVLIDMSGFNNVEYDATNQVAVIGSGQTWGDVYSELDRHKVTVVGGRVLDVGVGGLLLGSGLSYLSDLYGMACDNVVNFEVVLADGSLINANKSSNSNLFWALKGGANNFGIITSFTLYRSEDLPTLIATLLKYQSSPSRSPYANLFIQGFPTNSSFGVNLELVYLKPEESPEAFAPFYSIPTIADTTRLRTFSDFLTGQALFTIPSYCRVDWRTTSFEPDQTIYQKLLVTLTTSPDKDIVQSVTSGSLAYAFQPISPNLVNSGEQRGGNALGLSPVEQTWFTLDALWWSPEDDQLVHNAVQNLIDDIEDTTKSEGRYLQYQFMNDASWDQPVIAHYGAANVGRMKQVQAQYDPTLVFQRLVPGGFKLG